MGSRESCDGKLVLEEMNGTGFRIYGRGAPLAKCLSKGHRLIMVASYFSKWHEDKFCSSRFTTIQWVTCRITTGQLWSRGRLQPHKYCQLRLSAVSLKLRTKKEKGEVGTAVPRKRVTGKEI